MRNSLETLSRIQKWQIDEQRKILAVHLDEEDKLQKQLDATNAEFEREKEFCNQNGDTKDFGSYIKRYMKNRDSLESKLVKVRDKIEEIRDIISDMFKEQKTYEIVDESRKLKKKKELAEEEQKQLDEIGTNNYIKQNK